MPPEIQTRRVTTQGMRGRHVRICCHACVVAVGGVGAHGRGSSGDANVGRVLERRIRQTNHVWRQKVINLPIHEKKKYRARDRGSFKTREGKGG